MEKKLIRGGSVKFHKDGRITGYLARFTDEDNLDLYGDYFDENTDFMLGDYPVVGSPVLYNHGFDPDIGIKPLGRFTKVEVQLDPDDDGHRGLWIEAQLDEMDGYVQMLHELNERAMDKYGRGFGLSSGAGVHGNGVEWEGRHITKWAIIEGSLTLIPADPDNQLTSLKSLRELLEPDEFIDSDDQPTQEPEAQPSEGEQPTGAVNADVEPDTDDSAAPFDNDITVEVIPMTEQTPVDNQQDNAPPADPMLERMNTMEQKMSQFMDTMTGMFENEPRINRSGYVTVDGGDADPNIKNAGDMLLAIKRKDTKRLTKHYNLKAQYEEDGTTGGYYIPDEVLQDLMPGLSLTSGIGQLVTRIPVQSPAGEMPIRDYSRTPTANAGNTASAQGIESQSRGERGAYTEETIYFELLQYRVTDATSGYVEASRELAQDFAAIEGLLRNAIEEDVANKEEYFILRGNGVNQPLGILNWGGTIDLAEDTDNTFAIADADEMLSRLITSQPARTVWVHHPSIITSVAAFERGTGGAVYQNNIPGMLPESLHGYGRMNSQHLPQIGTDGYCILGDFSKYFCFERGGLYIDFSEHARFLNGEVVWRFGKRFDGKPAMTSAVTLADGSFTVSPFVAIQNLS